VSTRRQRPARFGASGRRLIGLMRPHRRLLCVALVLGSTSIAANIAGPRILGHVTDLVFSGATGHRLPAGLAKQAIVSRLRRHGQRNLASQIQSMNVIPGHGIDFRAVGGTLLILLGLYAVGGLLWIAQGRLLTTAIQQTVCRLRADVQAKLAGLPVSYFDEQAGDVLSRATHDIDNIAQTLQQTLSQVTNSLLVVTGTVFMMFLISPLLALITLVTLPASAVVAGVAGRRAQPQFSRQWAHMGALSTHIEEAYRGHALVKVFGQQGECEATFRAKNDMLSRSSFKAQLASGVIQPAMTFIGSLNYVLVAVVGGLRVASGALSIGDVQAIVQYSRQISQPLMQMANMANQVQSCVASAERVFELLDVAEQSGEESAGTPSRQPRTASGRVCFESVSFGYAPDRPLIEDLSLTAQRGQLVAIVGPSGAGKTTLINLLMRFYEVTGGRITLDGTDITTMPREELRSAIGMVLQDTWLFGGTIADNIAYGSPGATRELVVRAAQTAHADWLIRTLPDGYDTVIDEEGTMLSEGERQLITIARAYLSDPVIMVLDEATSSVDARTEALIRGAMARLRHGRTSFVIAHRLATIRHADLILVMENGAIVERGTHADLVAAGGAYARLHAARSGQPAGTAPAELS
jgi:ATP-binding cassette subfamily B protein